MSSPDQAKNPIHEETDLIGFDALWDADFHHVKSFITNKHKNLNSTGFDELNLLTKELEDKDFELQKLNWQLTERERELKNLYEELHKLIDLNKKLNNQLEDFAKLCEKQESLLQKVNTNPYKIKEPVLPSFEKN
jgi:hypothetical protein